MCGRVISQQTVDQMVDEVLRLPEGTRFQVLAPVVRGRKGTQQKEFEAARRSGFARVRVDGNMYELDEEIALETVSYTHLGLLPGARFWHAGGGPSARRQTVQKSVDVAHGAHVYVMLDAFGLFQLCLLYTSRCV